MPTKVKQLTEHVRGAPKLVAGVLALGLALPGLVLAWDAIVENDQVHFCYVEGSGTVYRVGEPGLPDHCHSGNHTPFTVNAQGPEGAPGQDGADGQDGISGYVKVREQGDLPLNGQVTVTAQCPAGKKVLSGGFIASSALDNVPMSRPTEDNDGWTVSFRSNEGSGAVRAFAICAAVLD